jgi:DNA-directed RNA polymerase subunit beta
VRVLKDDGSEVKLIESVDYGDTDMRHILDDDRRFGGKNETSRQELERAGFSAKEVVNGEEIDSEIPEESDELIPDPDDDFSDSEDTMENVFAEEDEYNE